MRLIAQAVMHTGGKHFRVYNDWEPAALGIEGVGWTVTDAVDDFVETFNRLQCLDQDSPIPLRRDDIKIVRQRRERISF